MEKFPRVRIALLMIEKDKILLVRHRKGEKTYWLLPGGGLEYGETISECAKREALEELSLEIALGDLLFANESIPSDKHRHVLNLYYQAKVIGGQIKLGDEEVLAEAAWIEIDLIDELTLYPNTKEILKKVA
ncbi:NUDIX hydrolase, partial [bacterium]|nr:NUDIX hydrolase [bacterium]MBU1614698.1 NUDIX hydrolase [bacterium]